MQNRKCIQKIGGKNLTHTVLLIVYETLKYPCQWYLHVFIPKHLKNSQLAVDELALFHYWLVKHRPKKEKVPEFHFNVIVKQITPNAFKD